MSLKDTENKQNSSQPPNEDTKPLLFETSNEENQTFRSSYMNSDTN